MRLFPCDGQEWIHQRRAGGATAPGQAHVEGLAEVGNRPCFNNVALERPGAVCHVRLYRHTQACGHQASDCFGGRRAQCHPWLQTGTINAAQLQSNMRALNVVAHEKYSDKDIADAPAAVAGKTELDAVVAYLQGMGRSAPKGG